MWLFALFDLPVTTKQARKEYAQFRKALLREGFTMLQFSVYARYCESDEAAEVYRRRVRRALPPEGQVRVVSVTDRQFGKMETYVGKSRKRPEAEPPQLVLF
jgi:CRISPR-associated protein Cas2